MAIPVIDHDVWSRKLRNLDDYQEDVKRITPQSSLMKPFGPSIWLVDDDSTRMVVIALPGGGGAWIWNPAVISDTLSDEIQARCGGVRHIVAPKPNPHLQDWSIMYPAAKLYIRPGMAVDDSLVTDFILTDQPMRDYGMEIDQVIFRGSRRDEVVFFHKQSQTVIFCDLIQRTIMDTTSVTGYLADAFGYANNQTPKEWQYSFWWGGEMELPSRALYKVKQQWNPVQLVVANGDCASTKAMDIIQDALSWIPEWSPPRTTQDVRVTLEPSLSRVSFTTGKEQPNLRVVTNNDDYGDGDDEQLSDPSFNRNGNSSRYEIHKGPPLSTNTASFDMPDIETGESFTVM
jgi:hypothetical protein